VKTRCSNQRNRALTLVELLVVVVIISVLACFLLPALNRAKVKAQSITCNGELKGVGVAFRIWEGDHTNRFPMSVSTNFGGTLEYVERGEIFRHFQVMSNELSTPKMVVCPSDVRHSAIDFGPTFSNTNISYFIGVDADDSRPQNLLSGDRNIAGGTKSANGILNISTNEFVAWNSEMHNGVGNIGFADGSVQQTRTLSELFQRSGLATNRLAIP
jgi:prepilin-type N-terminal cleavage/methylation domain-containing protein/prepilin-type processing-associated H-X9-DG protein